jgi:hypothetical protein
VNPDSLRWAEIPGYEGVYAIREDGEVMRTKAAQATAAGRRVKAFTNKSGYRVVMLSRECRVHQFRLHRLVAAAFLGSPTAERPEVNHKDGDKTNNHVSNLEYVNRSENMLHMRRVLGIKVSPAAYAHVATAARDSKGRLI